MEQVARLQKLSDFYHGAMDDRIGDNGTEKGGPELPTFLEVLRPFAARRWKSKIGAGPRETLQFETPAERFNACVASTG
jgi:hypothetical protein